VSAHISSIAGKRCCSPLQQEFGSGAIVDIGEMHAVLQQIALRINEQVMLAAVDL
jgi:hypothetical protein